MNQYQQSPGLIPDQLLNNIKKGDCVLFLGADLPLGYEGAPLSRPELAATLVEKYGLSPDRPWPETAQAYLGQHASDRHGLISFIAEHCIGPKVKPGPLHEAIARVGFRAIVTAWYDDMLEEALRQAGYRVNRVVRDTQLPYAGEGEREVIVIKLYGCLSDPESLVLGVQDQGKLMARLSRKLQFVTALCAMRPPLFVGFDLTNFIPLQLYIQATLDLAEHMRRAYAIWPYELEAVQATWQGMNVEFRQADVTAFLEALTSQLPITRPIAQGTIRVHRPPYKFLDYYESEDTDIFCGRDTESQIVTRLILSHRLLTLFGPSGTGKTSLLLAGVLPRLTAEGYQHVYVRALDDPLLAIRKAIAARAGQDDWQIGDTLSAFLHTILATEDKLVVVLDQFEELFLQIGSRQRIGFFAELATTLPQLDREVRFIFSLREDYLAYLDEARSYLPDIFSSSFRLTALEPRNARLAITEPAARAGVMIEPALVDILVGGEGREAGIQKGGALMEANGQVSPAALQIVLDRLYREALPPGHAPDEPPPSGLQLTLTTYQSIRHRLGGDTEELHGVEAILASYVDEGLARLNDPTLGEAILKVMITSQATKVALTQVEIVGLLDEAGFIRADDRADRDLAEQTRLGLERVRLLRGFERDGTALYELAHDYLALAIARRLDEAELETKLARELLHRELDNWREAGLLIPLEALVLIHKRRVDLKRLNIEALELLFRSTLAVGYEVAYWFKRAREGGVTDVDDFVLDGLKDTNFRTRAAAVLALSQLGPQFVDPLVAMLTDDYPQVRVATIISLEQLAPDGQWRKHLKYECYMPAEPFVMGDDSGEKGEKPAHEVPVNAFYIGEYLVTNTDYKRYMDNIGRSFDIPPGKAYHPVTNVSWYDSCDYATWAGMRLPTEAEWEKAASWNRTGKKRIYPWGDTFEKNNCNTEVSGIKDTTSVGQYSPAGDSPCGCADMAGNVWEWCNTLYTDYPYQFNDGRENMSDSGERVWRGGSFDDKPSSARCASRLHDYPSARYELVGFRVGWSAPSFLTSENSKREQDQ